MKSTIEIIILQGILFDDKSAWAEFKVVEYEKK